MLVGFLILKAQRIEHAEQLMLLSVSDFHIDILDQGSENIDVGPHWWVKTVEIAAIGQYYFKIAMEYIHLTPLGGTIVFLESYKAETLTLSPPNHGGAWWCFVAVCGLDGCYIIPMQSNRR